MTQEGGPQKFSPLQRLNRKEVSSNDVFDKDGMEEALWRIAHTHYLSDDDLSFVASLVAALSGTHPDLKVSIEKVPEGVVPRTLAMWARERQAMRLADFVDMHAARGMKQEAAVQEAMDLYSVSRREAFRMLKESRARRLQWLEWDGYDDFDIKKDGRLVPKKKLR
jgi:hypothetical protein